MIHYSDWEMIISGCGFSSLPLFHKPRANVMKPLQEKKERNAFQNDFLFLRNRQADYKEWFTIGLCFAAVETWERIKHPLQFGHHLLGLIVFLSEISDSLHQSY